MKVLVIGAAGMIGGKLTGRLLRDGAVAGEPIDGPAVAEAPGIATERHAVDLADAGEGAIRSERQLCLLSSTILPEERSMAFVFR